MTRIAVCSDVHGDLDGLRKVLDQVERLRCDRLLCLGDLVGYGDEPDQVVALIRQRRVTCVRGNNDASDARSGIDCEGRTLATPTAKFLGALPSSWSASIDGATLAAFHGCPGSAKTYVRANTPAEELCRLLDMAKADILLLGHTHEGMALRLDDGRLVLNPGSVLRPSFGATAARASGTFGVLELPARRFTVRRIDDGEVVLAH